jgi:RNA polymerase sigma factor (sigma-70 family)
MPITFTPSPSDFTLLCEVIRSVAHRSGLPPDDAEDFAQTVHLKLLERSYAPLARFNGRSSLRTYLVVVVKRLLLDWRNARYGKWRPSSCARQLGPVAIELDRLMSRDGHTPDEAVAILEDRSDGPHASMLRELASRLPRRSPMRTVLTEDLESLHVGTFEDPVEARQVATSKKRALARLRRAYQRLGPEDRRLLRLHFERNLSIAAIAALLGTPPKPLYRRMHKLFRSLRRELVVTNAVVTSTQ